MIRTMSPLRATRFAGNAFVEKEDHSWV